MIPKEQIDMLQTSHVFYALREQICTMQLWFLRHTQFCLKLYMFDVLQTHALIALIRAAIPNILKARAMSEL